MTKHEDRIAAEADAPEMIEQGGRVLLRAGSIGGVDPETGRDAPMAYYTHDGAQIEGLRPALPADLLAH